MKVNEYFYSGVIKKNTGAGYHTEVGFFSGNFETEYNCKLGVLMGEIVASISKTNACNINEVHMQQLYIVRSSEDE